MFDIGWPEFLTSLVVALLVIGPRDMPGALRQVGRWVRSARKVAREFQRHVDDAMREADLDDLKKGIDATRSFNVKRQVEKLVDPDGDLDPGDDAAAAKRAHLAKRKAPALDKPAPDAEAPTSPRADAPAGEAADPPREALDPNDPRRRKPAATPVRETAGRDEAGEAAAAADGGGARP